MKFSDVYVDTVLRDNFEDAKRLFFEPLMAIHRAHLVMLARVGIIPSAEARTLASALDEITSETVSQVAYDGTFEDLFFYVERLLTEKCGERTAGMLHTARSRNDIDVTLYRLRWREELAKTMAAALALREVLLEICERENETVFPVYTHTQPAQPSTLAHYFLGWVEHLERDHRRLKSSLEALNHCPLGSCAVTGTAFPIDRHLASRLLEFDGPTENTFASIANVDYLLEPIAALMVLLTSMGRWIHDLLLWSMAEFRFIRLDDGFVQPSSIMPQKRNPVALEHSRAIASKALGGASAVFHMLHNTPYADIVDVEDDLQPLVDTVFRDSLRPLKLLGAALSTARFDRELLAARAGQNWISMTELADTLVRRENLTFREAHKIASRIIRLVDSGTATSLSAALAAASAEITKKEIRYSEEDLERLLSPEHFVQSRNLFGGPAPAETEQAIGRAREALAVDSAWLAEFEGRLERFPQALGEEAKRL